MRAMLQQYLRRYRDREAIAAMSGRELDDLGLSREQALRFADMSPDVPRRVIAMAQVFGVTEDDLRKDDSTWLQMLETCEDCEALNACRRFLMLEDFVTAEQAGFCPNRATIAQQASPA